MMGRTVCMSCCRFSEIRGASDPYFEVRSGVRRLAVLHTMISTYRGQLQIFLSASVILSQADDITSTEI